MAVGEQVALHLAADRVLGAQLLGAHRGELGHDALQLFERVYFAGKAARDGNLLLALGHLLEGDALDSPQLIPGAQPRDAHACADPLLRQLDELTGRDEPHAVEHPPVAAPDAPDIPQREAAQHLVDILRAVHVATSLEPRVLLGQLRGDFGQRLGRGDADADRDARVAADGAPDAAAQLVEGAVDAPQVEEGLVNRVDLDAGNQRAQRRHHPPRHVAVEGEVGREDCHLPPLDERPHLVEGLPHADAEGFGLVRAGDDAAVVVREHHDGASHEVGPEDTLAGGVEVIAVGKGEHILSLIFSAIRIIQDVYHSKGTNNYTIYIYLCTYCSRYALGESPVCCLKYLRKVNCSGKFSCSAICLIFIEPFSSINLA